MILDREHKTPRDTAAKPTSSIAHVRRCMTCRAPLAAGWRPVICPDCTQEVDARSFDGVSRCAL